MVKCLTLFIILILTAIMVAAQTDDDTTLQIVSLTADVNAVSDTRLRENTQTITLTWEVINRPETVNLAFHQILPGGIPHNIELPRETVWVASSGSGVIMPVHPGDEITDILLLMRVIETDTGVTLDYRTMYLPIVTETVYAETYPDVPEPAASQSEITQADVAGVTVEQFTYPTPVTPQAALPQYTPTFTPTPQPLTPPRTQLAAPIIHDFHVYNEFPTLDDEVLLAWHVENADEVWAYGVRYNPYEFPQDAYASGANGGARMLVASIASVPGDHVVEMTARNSFTGEEVDAQFVLHVRAEPLPSQNGAQILSFTITPRSGNPDDIVTMAWETVDADMLMLNEQPFDGDLPGGSKQMRLGDLAELGEHWVSLSAISTQPGWANAGASTSVYIYE